MTESTVSRGEQSSILEQLRGWLGLDTAQQQMLGVTWLLLPPYDIPGMAVVSGLLVENQGQDEEQDIYISLAYEGERFISHMDVICEDEYEIEGGSPRDSQVTLRLPRLGAGNKVVIYVAGHSNQPPEVTVAVRAA